jgi:signal transduction histidine kinase
MLESIQQIIDKRAEGEIHKRAVNILLVDDKTDNLLSLESILKQEGRNIFKAISGKEALQIALNVEIGLVLLDVQMPEMDGFEVARLLKENPKTKDIAIIFVTTISEEEKFTMQGYEEGAVDWLHKPLETNIVKAKVAVFEKLYLQKKDLQRYAEKVEKINTQLDEFVYIVSHDLKAPLRGLASLSTFLEDELGTNPKQEIIDILTMMKSRTSRMQNLIDGILHYSRMGNSKTEKEKVDVTELIHSIIDLICPPQNIRIEFPGNLPVLNTERIKLHEVFQNLLSNGIKYNDKEKGVVKIAFEEKEKHYEFSVTDNGVGIKPEHQQKIFGIFQTLQPKDKIESTGIGLTIVKKIVEQQDGSIQVESEFGKGSTFRFSWMK